MIGNVIVVLLSLWNWIRRFDAGEAVVLPFGILRSLVVVLLLLYTGWRGWEMVYRHHVAVADDPRDPPSRAQQQHRQKEQELGLPG